MRTKPTNTVTERVLLRVLAVERRRNAQKRASEKWQAKNTKVVSTKVRKQTAEQFKALCEKNNTTRHIALKNYVEKAVALQKIVIE